MAISYVESEQKSGVTSSDEQLQPVPAASPEPAAGEITAARQHLAEIDASVFAEAVSLSPIQHNDLVRRAVRRLFGHGL